MHRYAVRFDSTYSHIVDPVCYEHQESLEDGETRLVIITRYYGMIMNPQGDHVANTSICFRVTKKHICSLSCDEPHHGRSNILRVFLLEAGVQEEIVLPGNMSDNIASFLSIRKLDRSVDCGAFAAHASGMSCRSNSVAEKWLETGPKEEKQLHIGDVIYMCERHSSRILHWAVYLGKGLYISKLGLGGNMSVTTHAELLKLYSKCDSEIYEAIPRRHTRTKRQYVIDNNRNKKPRTFL